MSPVKMVVIIFHKKQMYLFVSCQILNFFEDILNIILQNQITEKNWTINNFQPNRSRRFLKHELAQKLFESWVILLVAGNYVDLKYQRCPSSVPNNILYSSTFKV